MLKPERTIETLLAELPPEQRKPAEAELRRLNAAAELSDRTWLRDQFNKLRRGFEKPVA